MPAAPRQILVVDDDRAMREMLVSLFQDEGHWVDQAGRVDAALEKAAEHDFDVVVSDIKMPGRSGIELLGELRTLRPDTPVILMTAFGSIDAAVDAMRAGAFDYITKPFEPGTVQFTVARALEHRALARENQRLRRAVDKTKRLGDLIGESAAMRDLFSLVQKLSHNRSSVLITGESGTGKEVVARTIHFHGAQADAPFVPVNCTAIPEGLLESELFGHVRGAFTGAHASKAGLFEQANGGTLFLDEIGDMGLALQAKLLRVLQDQEIRPVGGTQTVKVDVRIIAATHQDLEAAIADGRFREDLFYRLNVIPIRIPPLRERPEDIPPLVEGFLQRHGDGSQRFTPEAIALLQSQPWRGNARELENVVERTLALSTNDTVEVGDLPIGGDLAVVGGNEHAFLDQAAKRGVSLRELSDQYVERVLEATDGNKVQAARILGIDRKTLYRRGERNQRDAEAQLSKEA